MDDKNREQVEFVEGQGSTSGKEATALSDHELEAAAGLKNERIPLKLDARLIPIVVLLYALSLIDRTNLAGARISGIDGALGLDLGNRYSVVLSVFYVGYVFFELPSNIILKKLGAPLWLSILALLFGVVTLGIGFSRNYATLLALRILLGIFEAGLFPACLYLLGSWYPRYALQKRVAIYFSCSTFLSSFANVLAYGLTQIADSPEEHGWRWIFIVQGAITIGIAILTFFIIPDFPEAKGNKFLSPEEKTRLLARLAYDRGSTEGGKVTWKVIKEVFMTWHIWTIGFLYIGGSCALYSFLFFLPIILRNSFNFSLIQAFCLSAPPAAFSVLYALGLGSLADKTHRRGVFAVGNCFVAIVGLSLTAFLDAPAGRYVGTFLGMGGATMVSSTALTWGQNNVRLDANRNVVTVTQVVFAAIGGIYSSQVFRQEDTPDYIPGIVATIAILGVDAILGTLTILFFARLNKKADRGEITIEGSADFRYTL